MKIIRIITGACVGYATAYRFTKDAMNDIQDSQKVIRITAVDNTKNCDWSSTSRICITFGIPCKL